MIIVKLVTIVCRRDTQQMLLQAESISRYLEPCEHIILVDSVTDRFSDHEEYWTRLLAKYYNNHELKLVFPSWSFTFNETDGWIRQQCWKHLVLEYVQDDYLILDSKNFFIRPDSLDNWQNYYCSQHLLDLSTTLTRYQALSKLYADYWGIAEQTHVPYMCTPQLFKKTVMGSIKNINQEMISFLNSKIKNPNSKHDGYFVSDFLWYFYKSLKIEGFSQWTQLIEGKIEPNFKTLWGPYIDLDFMSILNSLEENIKIVGFHRFFLKNLDHTNKNKINQWIIDQNLTHTL